MSPALVLVGATATGKSAVAARLAAAAGCEVLSMDSMQVYRGIPIVSAQPEPELTALAPHHLIEIVDPADHFDTAMWLDRVAELLPAIRARGHTPLFAGGTALYFRALLRGLADLPKADEELRARLIAEEAAQPGELHRRLGEVDPPSAAKLHPNDTRRLVRALEVHALTGAPLSAMVARPHRPVLDELVAVGIAAPRETLYARIDARADRMWAAGLPEEIRALAARLPAGRHTIQQAIGYPQTLGWLEGRWSEEEARRLLQRDSRRFARRQLMQFRAEECVRWTDPAIFPDVDALVAATRALWVRV